MNSRNIAFIPAVHTDFKESHNDSACDARFVCVRKHVPLRRREGAPLFSYGSVVSRRRRDVYFFFSYTLLIWCAHSGKRKKVREINGTYGYIMYIYIYVCARIGINGRTRRSYTRIIVIIIRHVETFVAST